MKKLWEQPLRRQLFVFILLLLVPVLGAAIWSAYATYRERIADLNEQTRVSALGLAETMSREMKGLDRLTRNLELRLLNVNDTAEPMSIAERMVSERPGLLNLTAVRRNGEEIVLTLKDNDELADGAWAKPVFETGRTSITEVPRHENGGTPTQARFVFAFPLRDSQGNIGGAVGYMFGVQDLQNAFTSIRLPQGSIVSINDEQGRTLSRNIEAEKYLGKIAYQPNSPTLQNEERVGMDGIRRVYARVPIEGTPWRLSVGIPTQIAVDKTLTLWTRTTLVLALGLGGWLIIAVIMSRRLGQSVAHLDQSAQRIAAGDFSPLEKKKMATREFSELQQAFDQMVRSFNESRNSLDAQMNEERGMREELQSLQRQVIRQERLAAVGQLVSGVAHEINNPLQAILGFAELLQMQTQLPEEVKADLKLIQKESARACGIIRNLALFARQQQGEAAPLSLRDVITSVAELRQRRLESEQIELRVDDTSTQHVLAALPELQQVVLNFVVNAEQSVVMSGRLPGRITIRTRDENGMVVLEVEDTGPGVPPDNEAKLFQPFYTTKPVGQGTGLGLSVSYGIIDSLDGRIGYRRAPAGGAIFYFELPAAPAAV